VRRRSGVKFSSETFLTKLKMTQNLGTKRTFYLIMTLITAGVIFYASTIETTAGVASGLNLAALYHFGIFFIFTFFLSLTLLQKRLNTKTILLILSISLIYALSDELHQLFVPGRLASLKDVLTDLGGSLFSVLFLKLFERFGKI
jgi:hypothetical protein